MVLLESTKIPMGSEVIDFSLQGYYFNLGEKKISQKNFSLADFENSEVLVVIFMCNHCPYVQAIWPRLVALQEKLPMEKVQLIGINSNLNPDYPEETFEKMEKYFQEYRTNFPYLQDPTQEIAQKYQAKCTPDIYLYNKERKLVYHGRLDDNWKNPDQVENKDLEIAIEKTLQGQEIDFPQKPAMGCSIKWRKE